MLRLEEELVKYSSSLGVFCFIDFVSYVLRHITDKIAREKYECTNNKIFINENLCTNLKGDFKLVYFSSFSDQESSVYHTICEKLYDLDKKYNLNIFKYVYRFSNEDKARWDTNYLCNALASYKNSITRAYICGPTGFLDYIKNSLIDGLIVPQNKIYLA